MPEPLHASATALLEAWPAPNPAQDDLRHQILDHLANHEDAMWRTCPTGHLTGSVLIIDADHTHGLFTLHPKIGRWLQMGGHCEAGDGDLAATARREAVEESGIDGLVLQPGPVDLDIHRLDCPKGHPNRHLDVRWLAVAPPGAVERPSEESPHLRWFPLDRPPDDADESTLRLVRLARKLTRSPVVTLGGMTPEEFRKQGYALVDWITDYLEGIERHPVASPFEPGWVRSQLPAAPPTEPESFDAVLADLDRVIVPGLTQWQHPSFFAYFPANTSYPAILGDLAASGLGVNGMSWATSPACTELETLMLDWMVDLLGLPDGFRSTGAGGGVIQGSASEATLCAILAARERVTAGAGNRVGAPGDLVAYATSQAHSSIEKAIRVAGIGSENLRIVAHDERFAMRPDALEAAIAEDRAAGRRPFFVSATAGTTSTTAFDPVPELAAISRREGLWLHVDGAMSGIAALRPELRWVNDGLDDVDSYCTNPHKWMGVNFDCDLFWVADRSALLAALSILPEYLRTAAGEAGAVIDYRDWQIPLGRRFRSLKLWFTLRTDGVAAIQAMIGDHVSWSQELAGWVEADERFELVAPHPLNLVCLALTAGNPKAGNLATDALIEAANSTGRALFTRSSVDGRSILRFSVGGRLTQRRHVQAGWQLLQELASDLI